ncbi:MAG: PhnA protein [Alphaproteobacteria bacterium]|jgi:protein PhnA|nr:PhnA protein [Alphaproteobacteria bacterium]MBT4017315.1 PhnA protein [Alphaproteobacteria bacterium]MBT4965604.1 PhnA protein [Alphaproteobacteria bacterium]MBT5161222.1 PhnA protein [Alphaproteobacteria bacterium]MBT6384408.1 PhnA protein [Alphaproteobacteria bacterium]
MSTETELRERSENACELCASSQALGIYEVLPESDGSVQKCLLICEVCRDQVENPDKMDMNHWRCLNESMWSQVPAVQVMAWRMLKRYSAETWAADLLDMLYLDDDVVAWAQQVGTEVDDDVSVRHLDSNGSLLAAGDTVTLIKDLNVKGANFTAKRGTAVRNISLVPDNELHIEGRINGQQIVILTEFVKK